MSKLMAVLSLAAALILPGMAAKADGSEAQWIKRAFNLDRTENRSTAQDSRSASSRRAALEDGSATPTRKRAARMAEADDGDENIRPQRHAAFKPRPHDSVTGGSGQTGVASYYWEPQALASGGRFNPNAMTAAHKTLPFGTRVRVTRVDNGRSVEVVINDRGPYVGGRIIDLSRRAAQALSMTGAGVARVRVSILGRG